MKRILFISALAFISLSGIYAMGKFNVKPAQAEDIPVEKLWKEYDDAQKADRPQKQLEILDLIKKAATRDRLHWDFYKAGRATVDVGSSRNWKMRDSLRRQFSREIEDYGEPVVTFHYQRQSTNDLLDFVDGHRAELEKGRNPMFWSNDRYFRGETQDFLDAYIAFLGNDYQYALLSLDNGKAGQLLKEAVAGLYPVSQLVDLMSIGNMDEFRRKEYYEKFADSYKGKAVALAAREKLLEMEFRLLNGNGQRERGSSEEFKAFRAKCETFEAERAAFSGDEKTVAACCRQVSGFITELDRKSLSLTIDDGIATITFRNLPDADLTILEGKKEIFSRKIDNPARSYYLDDKVDFTLPALNDGAYTVICRKGKEKAEADYNKYTISVSLKQDSEGYSAFAADALTGEPLKAAGYTLYKDGKVISDFTVISSGGYTRLPASFFEKVGDDAWKYELECRAIAPDGLVRKSRRADLPESYDGTDDENEDLFASIFVDRTAFNPDETVHFKAVLYHGDPRVSLKPLDAGFDFAATLYNAKDEIIETRKLTTNGFGSLAGSFILKRGERNGTYRLAITDGKYSIAEKYLTVDDFILPTFTLTFDPDTRIYFPGDEIEVKGTLKSYSGHSLAAADILCTITESGKTIKEETLKPADDGTFDIRFKADGDDWLSYNIGIRVTDATGETLEWSTWREARKQIPFNVTLTNKEDASINFTERHEYVPNESYRYAATGSDIFDILLESRDWNRKENLDRSTLKIDWSLTRNGETLSEGTSKPGADLKLNTAGHPSGLYTFTAKASDTDIYGNLITSLVTFDILKVKDNDNTLDADVTNIFKVVNDGDDIGVLTGSTTGPVWACVDLYGEGNILLGSRLIHLDGVKGQPGSLVRTAFRWEEDWSDAVYLRVIYFKNYERFTYEHYFDRSRTRLALPLSFTRFLDRTNPGTPYSLEITTNPDVECAATIFDKSTEAISANLWNRVALQKYRTLSSVSYNDECGINGSEPEFRYFRAMESKAAAAPGNALEETVALGYAINDSLEMENEESAEVEVTSASVTVRENFANTIAFEPFLHSGSDGKIELKFTTADKLSTYYVQLFAHDKEMNNAVIRQEMTVTIPVKVSVVEPLHLYEGDIYNVKASLSSSMDEPVSGTLRVDFYDGKDYRAASPFRSLSKKVSITGLGALSEEFPVEVPALKDLGIKISFIADNSSFGSDAVFVSIPVSPAVQTITESHSSILHTGESRETLIEELRSQFVNGNAADAAIREISILDMVREAVPTKVDPASDNSLDLSEALYARMIASSLGSPALSASSMTNEELLIRLNACRQSDGGFSWFKDMSSSPVITAVLLQRYAGLRARGIATPGINSETISGAVKYLDSSYFSETDRPFWRGGISFEQYCSVRSMFPEIEFSAKDRDVVKEFRKDVKEFLTPSKERGLNGQILRKARRIRILLNLSSSEDGKALAKEWGIKNGTLSKLNSSRSADLKSLQEYAIAHKCGGWYYPNAVMPFRGLLESEAYAHSFIADLLRDCGVDDNIAEGIRLWLMIQKETQHWDEDASFVEAIATIMDATEATLDTKVISLTGSFTMPFKEVKASGNGMSIGCRYLIDGKEITDGHELKVGDKITAEYRIWNEENRSFVKLTAPRPASFRPVNQLSGYNWLSGYRSVLADRTEYWYESYPEETTTVTEDFFITQSGTFQSPAIEIESLYSPHYRANASGAE